MINAVARQGPLEVCYIERLSGTQRDVGRDWDKMKETLMETETDCATRKQQATTESSREQAGLYFMVV